MTSNVRRFFFILSLLIKAILVSGVITSTLLMLKSVADLDNARHIQESATTVKMLLLDAETGQRGYVLTGDARFLDPFNNAQQNLVPEIRKFNSYMDGAREKLIAGDMVDLAMSKMSELAVSIHVRDTLGFEAGQNIVKNYSGKSIMDDLRVILDQASTNSSAEMTRVETCIETLGNLIVGLVLLLPFLVILTFWSVGIVKGSRPMGTR